MNIATVKISRERPVEGLYQLLAATELLRPDRIACESALDNLNDRIAEPLRGMIDQALEWVAEIETTISTNTQLPVAERRSVADACFKAQRDLRRALRELGLSNCSIDQAVERCEIAASRVRSSLTLMVASMGERDLDSTMEWRNANHSQAQTIEHRRPAMGKGPRFARFKPPTSPVSEPRVSTQGPDFEIRPRRLANGTGTPEFRRVPPPPQRPLIANAIIATPEAPPRRAPSPTTSVVSMPPVPPLPSLLEPADPVEPVSQTYSYQPPKSTGETLLERLTRSKRRTRARLRRRATEIRRN